MLFGQRFVWVTDCYALRFILSYDGTNPAILCLQMQLMGWDVDIVYQNDHYMTDADYWSRLGTDLCFDPLFKTYLLDIWYSTVWYNLQTYSKLHNEPLRPPVHTKTDRDQQSHHIFLIPRKQLPRQEWMIK
jgi:hypothetical protein